LNVTAVVLVAQDGPTAGSIVRLGIATLLLVEVLEAVAAGAQRPRFTPDG